MLKGVEFYRGRPIYHGLGNFVCVTYAMTAGHNISPEMTAYLKQREKEGRGGGHYKVDFYPWSEKSRLTVIAKVIAGKDGIRECGFIPAYIEDSGNVAVRGRDDGGEAVLEFMRTQTNGADLGVRMEWSDDGSWIRML